MQTDAFSVNTALSEAYWTGFHTYRVEWRAGRGGFMRWSLDGAVQFQIEESLLRTPRAVSAANGRPIGTLRRRELPREPMYLILNVDSSPRWGWPSHSNCTHEESVLGCECCFDCKRQACTRCMAPYGPNGTVVNTRAWFGALCDDLPADYLVDYVRVWQLAGTSASVGCDPPSHPTATWIRNHSDDYRTALMDEPLAAVVPGGASCAADSECGGFGSCVHGTCQCAASTAVNWTGPRCLSQAAGAGAACWAFEAGARRRSAAADGDVPRDTCWLTPSYGASTQRALIDALCSQRGAKALSRRAAAAVAAACADVDVGGVHGECSAFARASHVLWTRYIESGHAECCNVLSIGYDGTPLAHCVRGGALLGWLVAIVLIGAGAAVVLTIRARSRSPRAAKHQPLQPVATTAPNAGGEVAPAAAAAEVAPAAAAADADGRLASVLLTQLAEPRQAERRALMQRLAELVGCQPASWMNQAEHLESLLLSHLCTSEGDYAAAVDALHRALLRPFKRWSLHLSGESASRWNGLEEDAYEWDAPETTQQLIDVALYLLLWGEAANLRFMPELLLFLFALARARCIAASATARVGGSSSSAVLDSSLELDPVTAGHVHTATASQAALQLLRGAARPEFSGARGSSSTRPTFLEGIVRPLYNGIFGETFTGLHKGRPQPRTASTGLPVHPRNCALDAESTTRCVTRRCPPPPRPPPRRPWPPTPPPPRCPPAPLPVPCAPAASLIAGHRLCLPRAQTTTGTSSSGRRAHCGGCALAPAH